MRMLRSILLAVVLSVSACYAQAPAPAVKEVREFDVASCSPSNFTAAHIEISKNALTIYKVVPSPGTVELISPPNVYKQTVEDKDGKHYVLGEFEIVVERIDSKGMLIGVLKRNETAVAVFYGVESDGSDVKLLSNANVELVACIEVLKDAADKAPKNQDVPVAKEDPSINKI